jgi:hypothetical protein
MEHTPIKKLVIAVQSPFLQRDVERYDVNAFQKLGVEIEVWDCTQFFFPAVATFFENTTKATFPELKVVNSEAEALKRIKELPRDTVVWLSMYYDIKVGRLIRAIHLAGGRVGMENLGAVPPLIQGHRLSYKIRRILLEPSLLIAHLFNYLPKSALKMKPIDYFIYGGEKAHFSHLPMDARTKKVSAHSFDYNRFLKLKESGASLKSKKFAVYLDEYIPFHPDQLLGVYRCPVTPESYHKKINTFFDLVEKTEGIEIKIAAHPKSKYHTMSTAFGSREIIKGQTDQLIQNSEFVMGHTSTSLGMAFMFRRPIIILQLNEFRGSTYGKWVESMASSVGAGPFYVEDAESLHWRAALKINDKAFENYIKNYVKEPGVPDLPLSRLIFENVLK